MYQWTDHVDEKWSVVFKISSITRSEVLITPPGAEVVAPPRGLLARLRLRLRLRSGSWLGLGSSHHPEAEQQENSKEGNEASDHFAGDWASVRASANLYSYLYPVVLLFSIKNILENNLYHIYKTDVIHIFHCFLHWVSYNVHLYAA